jgi:hypothetical protein
VGRRAKGWGEGGGAQFLAGKPYDTLHIFLSSINLPPCQNPLSRRFP